MCGCNAKTSLGFRCRTWGQLVTYAENRTTSNVSAASTPRVPTATRSMRSTHRPARSPALPPASPSSPPFRDGGQRPPDHRRHLRWCRPANHDHGHARRNRRTRKRPCQRRHRQRDRARRDEHDPGAGTATGHMPGATIIGFDTMSTRRVTAPAHTLLGRSSASSATCRVEYLHRAPGHNAGERRAATPRTAGEPHARTWRHRRGDRAGMPASATLNVEPSFHRVTFLPPNNCSARAGSSQVIALRRGLPISGFGSRRTFTVRGAI